MGFASVVQTVSMAMFDAAWRVLALLASLSLATALSFLRQGTVHSLNPVALPGVGGVDVRVAYPLSG